MSESEAQPPEGETQNWLRRAQVGGVTEFGVLYDHVAPSIYAWATLRLARDRRSEIDAQDVVQEVWLRAWDSIERIDAETTPFRKWIFRVAKRVLLELLRAGRRRRQVNLWSETKRAVFEQVMDPATAISARIERDDTLARFLESVAGLPEKDRKLVSYCGLEGLGYEVAAQRLEAKLLVERARLFEVLDGEAHRERAERQRRADRREHRVGRPGRVLEAAARGHGAERGEQEHGGASGRHG